MVVVCVDFFYQEFSEYTNFDECLAYIEDFMIKHGPFDGLMGFSQVLDLINFQFRVLFFRLT